MQYYAAVPENQQSSTAMITVKKARYHGILLPELDIGFDFSDSGTRHIFITHAHSDHMPRNRSAAVFCTENTLRLMKQRGYRGNATTLPFFKPLDLDSARVTLYPAGHILGSAMVYVESDGGNVLYTGDYRTPPSPATEGFEMPGRVDYFITEATFGLPVYKWDPTEELVEEICTFATETLEGGSTPVFLAYNLGKAQEIMHMLAPIGHPVQIHKDGYRHCRVYEEAGIPLGNYAAYDPETCEGKILVAPSTALNNGFASHVSRKRLAYCSGWAAREATRTQLNVDKLIPLSDHLDFFELIRLCEELEPVKVYVTHTPDAEVVRHYLKERNIDSVFLDMEIETDD